MYGVCAAITVNPDTDIDEVLLDGPRNPWRTLVSLWLPGTLFSQVVDGIWIAIRCPFSVPNSVITWYLLEARKYVSEGHA